MEASRFHYADPLKAHTLASLLPSRSVTPRLVYQATSTGRDGFDHPQVRQCEQCDW